MFYHGGAVLLCRAGIGKHRPRGIDIALAVSPQSAEDPVCRQHRTHLASLLGRDKPHILDADTLIDPVGGLQPFPAIRRAGQRQSAGHVHADRLPAFLLDLAKKVDRIGLQGGNIGIGIQRMHTTSGMPARPGRQHRPFNQADIRPPHLRQMIDDRRTNDTATDDHHAIMRFHILLPLRSGILDKDQSLPAACPPVFAPATGTAPFPPTGETALQCRWPNADDGTGLAGISQC